MKEILQAIMVIFVLIFILLNISLVAFVSDGLTVEYGQLPVDPAQYFFTIK